MSDQGVQMERPMEKAQPMLKTVFQMTYQRKVSRKKRHKSMIVMIVRAKAGWLRQRPAPKYLSLQFCTVIVIMIASGSRKESVRKK